MPNTMVSLRLFEDSKGTQMSVEVSKLQKVIKDQGKQGNEDCEIDMLDTYHIHIQFAEHVNIVSCSVYLYMTTS